jgi:hypothetical protein
VRVTDAIVRGDLVGGIAQAIEAFADVHPDGAIHEEHVESRSGIEVGRRDVVEQLDGLWSTTIATGSARGEGGGADGTSVKPFPRASVHAPSGSRLATISTVRRIAAANPACFIPSGLQGDVVRTTPTLDRRNPAIPRV